MSFIDPPKSSQELDAKIAEAEEAVEKARKALSTKKKKLESQKEDKKRDDLAKKNFQNSLLRRMIDDCDSFPIDGINSYKIKRWIHKYFTDPKERELLGIDDKQDSGSSEKTEISVECPEKSVVD